VFGTILHRMILRELCKVFVMSLVGITGILLMAGIIAEASQQGLGPGQILAAIPLLVPSTLPYTIPATTLFATCVVYGRLSADNEILAIKAAGINVLVVVRPAIYLGLAMSTMTLGLYYRLIPRTHHMLRSMVFNDAEELLYSILKKQGMISHSQMPYSMYVKSVQGRTLMQPVFKKRAKEGTIEVVAYAREAELRVDMANGLVLIHMKHGNVCSPGGDQGYFEQKTFDVPLPNSFGKDANRRPRDMSWQELLERRVELEAELAKKSALIAAKMAQKMMAGAPKDLPQDIQNHKNERQIRQQQILLLDVEMLMRPALSLGCLCFILVGCPVGILLSRSDYLSSFVTAFLPIVFIYYPLMLCGTNMAREGRFNPVGLVWGADALVGFAGLVLFRKLLQN
jgi:lipopolysaccharide export system permease protein